MSVAPDVSKVGLRMMLSNSYALLLFSTHAPTEPSFGLKIASATREQRRDGTNQFVKGLRDLVDEGDQLAHGLLLNASDLGERKFK